MNDGRLLEHEFKNKKIIGKMIRQVRKSKDLTIAKLAEYVGISDNYLGKIERGQILPSLAIIVKVANVLEVSVDYLLDENLDLNTKNIEEIDDFIYQNITTLSVANKKYIYNLLNTLN